MALRRKSTAAAPVVIAVVKIWRKKIGRFPRVNYSVPDDSQYETHNGKLHAIITTTPRGLKLAWDNCGACLQHIRVCKCSGGITLPTSIGYLYAKEGGALPPKPMFQAEERAWFVPKPKARRVEPDRFPQFQAPSIVEPISPKRKLRRKIHLDESLPKRTLRRKAA